MASKRGPECDGSEESKKRRRVAFDQVAYFSIPVNKIPDVLMWKTTHKQFLITLAPCYNFWPGSMYFSTKRCRPENNVDARLIPRLMTLKLFDYQIPPGEGVQVPQKTRLCLCAQSGNNDSQLSCIFMLLCWFIQPDTNNELIYGQNWFLVIENLRCFYHNQMYLEQDFVQKT